MIVQDALAVMNPVTTVGEQIGEMVRDHRGGSWREIRGQALQTGSQIEPIDARR